MIFPKPTSTSPSEERAPDPKAEVDDRLPEDQAATEEEKDALEDETSAEARTKNNGAPEGVASSGTDIAGFGV